MTDNCTPVLSAEDLVRLAQAHPATACGQCAAIRAPGWEALPGSFDRALLERTGTLRQPEVDDPTLEEFHPQGTNAWSPQAPVAPAHFPYNRCEVWQCTRCRRPFLRYTEYGGYYMEERIRELHAERVVDA